MHGVSVAAHKLAAEGLCFVHKALNGKGVGHNIAGGDYKEVLLGAGPYPNSDLTDPRHRLGCDKAEASKPTRPANGKRRLTATP